MQADEPGAAPHRDAADDTAVTRLRTRVLDRSDAGAVWTALDARRPPALAASWPWTQIWLDHYGDVVDARPVVVERDGEDVAIALLSRSVLRRRGVPVRVAHVGTAGEPPEDTVYIERNSLHAAPEDRAEVAAALVDRLREDGGWDLLRLDGFVAGDGEDLARAHGNVDLERQDSPLCDLSAARENGGEVVAALRSGPRRRARQTLRAFGELELEWADNEADAASILDELAALHQRRWTDAGEPGKFASERFSAFHHAAVRRLGPGRGAIVVRVTAAGKGTVGCLLSYVDGDRVLFYQSGFGSFEHSAQRPGIASHLLCMQACAQRGFAVYEFLPGEGRYKDDLSTGRDELVWGTATAASLRGRAVQSAVALRRRLRAG